MEVVIWWLVWDLNTAFLNVIAVWRGNCPSVPPRGGVRITWKACYSSGAWFSPVELLSQSV